MASPQHRFARRASGFQASVIREILKVTERPDVISFAGGLPAPELFPVEAMRRAIDEVLAADGPAALQYGATEGYGPLREVVARSLSENGVPTPSNGVLITSGSQQGLDLLARVFLDPGDRVAVESPSYLGALQAFGAYEAVPVPIPTDDEGMVPEALQEALRTARPKLVYLNPTFKNPTGTTMGLERRRSIARAVGGAGVLLIEDEPYAELRYSGEPLPALRSFDPERIAYLGTCSKTVAPGLRVGWVAAEPALLARLVLAKQGMDLHTSTLSQRALHRYLTTADVGAHLGRLRREYGGRRDVMTAALRSRFPPGISWTDPQGGMFIWVRMPPSLDAGALLEEAVARKVAYVPGAPFFPDGGGQNHLRLNFSNAPPARIDEGIARLAEVIARAMDSGDR